MTETTSEKHPQEKSTPSTILSFSILLFFLSVFFIGTTDATDPDTFWHIRTGQDILKTGSIPQIDEYSYTAKGEPAGYTDWGFGLLLALWTNLFGLNGLVWLKGILLAGALAGLVLVFRKYNLPWPVVFLLGFLCAWSLRFRMLARPQLVSLLMICFYLLVLENHRKSARWQTPVFLFFTMLAWSCIHKGCLFGLFIIGAYFAESLASLIPGIRNWFDREENNDHRKTALLLGAGLVAAIIAYLITPLSMERLGEMFRILGAEKRFELFIVEYKSLSFLADPWYFFLLGGALILLVIHFKKMRLALLIMTLILGFLGIKYQRLVEIASPALAITWAYYLALLFKNRLAINRISPLLSAFAIFALTLTISTSGFSKPLLPPLDMSRQPVQAVKFADKIKLTGPMYNSFGYGGYLVYQFDPRRPVFWDGRVAPYDKLIDEVLSVPVGQILDKYNFAWAIIESRQVVRQNAVMPFEAEFQNPEKWLPVYFDDTATIFVRMDGPNRKQGEKYGFQIIKPWLAGFGPMRSMLGNPDFALAAKQEAARAFIQCDGATPLLWVSSLQWELGAKNQALETLEKAERTNPTHYMTLARLGRTLVALDHPDKALSPLKKALKLVPKSETVAMNLGVAELKLGNPRKAAFYFKKALKLKPGWKNALYNLSYAYEDLGKKKELLGVYEQLLKKPLPEKEKALLQKKATALQP